MKAFRKSAFLPFARRRTQTEVDPVSMTQESHRDQTDVNAIVARFDRTGQLPPATRQPQYGDVTDLQVDLTEAINRSRHAISTAQEFADQWQPAPPAPEPAPAPNPDPVATPVAPTGRPPAD